MKIPKPYYDTWMTTGNQRNHRVWTVNWIVLVMVMAFGWFWGFGIAWVLAGLL